MENENTFRALIAQQCVHDRACRLTSQSLSHEGTFGRIVVAVPSGREPESPAIFRDRVPGEIIPCRNKRGMDFQLENKFSVELNVSRLISR